MTKTTLWISGIGIVTGFYATFVLQQLWNWFLTSALNVGEISFWGMYGIQMVFGLLMHHGQADFQDEVRWEGLATMVEACVPEERREKLTEEITLQSEGMWAKAGAKVRAKAVEYTVTLAIGWVVHLVAF
jgi:hypothetical protein